MFVTQAIHQNVQRHAHKTATICGDREQNWSSFKHRVACLAGALRAFGLKDDVRVAILADNSDRYLEVCFAVPWAGGVIVPINTRWAVSEIAHALNDSTPFFLFVDHNHEQKVAAICEETNHHMEIVFMGDGVPMEGTHSQEALIVEHDPIDDRGRGGDDLSGIFYTGGTTGRSKGVMLTHDNHCFNSIAMVATAQLPGEICYLHAAPMFHIADALFIYAATMVGATQVILPKFSADMTCQAIERYRVTDTILVPTMINMLLNFPDLDRFDLKSLERMFYGASPMPEAVLLKLLDSLPMCQPIQLYGQTEAAPVLTVLEGKFHVTEGPLKERLRSAGRAMYGVEVKVVDESGIECPVGTPGEVVARAPNVMKGYWNLPSESAEALRDGWLHTGDIAYLDQEGFLFICDRLKDMIISGGENVYSAEVENVIHPHSDVAECAVIGMPDEEWGERVHAVVVPKPGADLTETAIIEYCRGRLAGYKCPRSVSIRQESLPVSGAGKILKTALREEYAEA